MEKGEQTMNEGSSFCNNLLEFAKLPKNNLHNQAELDNCARYGIALIEHDYPGKTPAMWNAVYRSLGIDYGVAMIVGDPTKASEILSNLRADPKYFGGGAGVGFKDVSINYVDELDPLAEAIGAINLIQKLPTGKLKGWNTDGIGYRQSLEGILAEKNETLDGTKVVILGAGGTSNAIAVSLAEKGANIVVLNRTIEKAGELASRINNFVGREQARAGGEDMTEHEVKDASVIINVSTKGATGTLEEYSALAPAKLPSTPENIAENLAAAEKIFDIIPPSAILSDIVLRATPSPFLKRAQERGFMTLDGVPMVINQGVEAFLIVHGEELNNKNNLREQVYKIMYQAANF